MKLKNFFRSLLDKIIVVTIKPEFSRNMLENYKPSLGKWKQSKLRGLLIKKGMDTGDIIQFLKIYSHCRRLKTPVVASTLSSKSWLSIS